MNTEQKQLALTALGMWHSSNDGSQREYQAAELMAALLQELTAEPEAEPVAWLSVDILGERYLCFSKPLDNDKIVPLYTTPPAPSVPDGLLEWAIAGWNREVSQRPLENKHRRTLDDVWRQVIVFAGGNPDDLLGTSHDELIAAAPTPPEPPADVVRDAERYRWLRNPAQEVGLVLDKRVGESKSGYGIYEYRAGEELDAAIDAAIEREILGETK